MRILSHSWNAIYIYQKSIYLRYWHSTWAFRKHHNESNYFPVMKKSMTTKKYAIERWTRNWIAPVGCHLNEDYPRFLLISPQQRYSLCGLGCTATPRGTIRQTARSPSGTGFRRSRSPNPDQSCSTTRTRLDVRSNGDAQIGHWPGGRAESSSSPEALRRRGQRSAASRKKKTWRWSGGGGDPSLARVGVSGGEIKGRLESNRLGNRERDEWVETRNDDELSTRVRGTVVVRTVRIAWCSNFAANGNIWCLLI